MIITHLGARGDGVVADHFVAGALPGDVVALGADGKAFVVQKGPHHLAPPCAHAQPCGGCSLQHASHEVYRTWCTDRILAALSQHRLSPEQVAPAHVSPPGARRRVVMKALRSRDGLLLGFNRKSQHSLVDVDQCVVAHPQINALLAPLRALLLKALRINQSLSIHITRAGNGLDLLLTPFSVTDLGSRQRLIDFALEQNLARLATGGPAGHEIILEASAPLLHFDDVPVLLPVESFTQATPDGESAMIAAALEAIGNAKRVADLFCGIGTFALPLSARAQVHAVEGAQAPLKALERAAMAARRRISIEHRDLFRRPLTATELNRFDAVLFDPPRAGALAQSAELAKSTVSRVIAVSCNPSTFARDAELMARGGYRLQKLSPIGQFLWSLHVELVALFERT